MKTLAIYTISISPHITSYWKKIQEIWEGDTYYYYKTSKHDFEREQIGWQNESVERAICVNSETYKKMYQSDVLIEAMRDVHLIDNRLKNKKITFYSSERWFKPPWGIFLIQNR